MARKTLATLCVALFTCMDMARAQSTVAPAIDDGKAPEYSSRSLTAGPVKLIPRMEFNLDFDSNVYANPNDEKSDAIFRFNPQLQASYARQDLQLNTFASVGVTRFASISKENSVTGTVQGNLSWQPQSGTQIRANLGFSRLSEDRGTVESSNSPATSPRITNLLSATLGYHRERGRILFDLSGGAQKFDATSPSDDARDFSAYNIIAKTGIRLAGTMFVTVTGFATYRDFRLPTEGTLSDRDSFTYGARAGFDLTSNAFLQGHLGVGLFRYDARSAIFADHTGLSIDASLTYRPRRRTAIVLDAVRGDVATFRLGATSRTDTQFGLAIQQAARHNLFGSLGISWRETRYQNDTKIFRILSGQGQVEYLFSRHAAAVATVTYTKRNSNDPQGRFERFRVGLAVRLAL